MNGTSQPKLHSQDYFNEQRDYWWNSDFLELMATRWQLKDVTKMLDVGCGIGHWGQLLAKHVASNCEIFGVDREAEWIRQASERANGRQLSQTFHYQVSTAEKLPFADSTFDLVTCQTLLIHVRDPALALREFLRVLKPGGQLMVAEPNNMANHLVLNSLSNNESTDDIIARVKFFLTCERGKTSLGLGNNSLGDLVPGLFGQLGLRDIKVFLSDKTSPLVPPYDEKNQQIDISQLRDFAAREIFAWDYEETRTYYLAGGGSEESFQKFWTTAGKFKDILNAIDKKEYHTGGGLIFYLVSGRK